MSTSQHRQYKPTSYELIRDNKYGTSGLAVIFAFERFPNPDKRRDGTSEEIHHMISFFEQLNLRVYVLRDLTLPEMVRTLKVITNPDRYERDARVPDNVWECRVRKEDSMSFIAITSHGDNTCFELSDGNTMKDVDLEKYFYEDVCSSLVGCPKLYMYNKCRNYEGEERYERASPIETIETDGLGYNTANNLTSAIPDLNMLAVYTCADGIKSLRSTSSGSLILSELPAAYREFGINMEVMEFFTEFQDRMCRFIGAKMEQMVDKPIFKNVTQIPSLERITLRYKLYFHSPVPDIRDNGWRHQTTHSATDMHSVESGTQIHRIVSSQRVHPITTSLQHNHVCSSHEAHNVTAYEGRQPQTELTKTSQ